MSGSLATLIPELQPFARALINAAANARMNPRVTSTRRSTAEQARLYQRYIAGQSQYPVAPPGTSAHEFGYAFDMIVSYADWLPQLGHLWQSWGGVWGGAFNDPIHFEFPGFPKQAPHPKYWDLVESIGISSLSAPSQAVVGIGQLLAGKSEEALSTLTGPLGEYLFPRQR